MISFLFWNLGGNAPLDALTGFVRQHALDVILLAEWGGLDVAELLARLSSGGTFHALPIQGCRKILLLSRLAPSRWSPVRDTQDMTLRALQVEGDNEILIAALHLPSRLRNNSRATQAALCEDIAAQIDRAEVARHCVRTILVGDLNQDPYDPGMIHATALNAVLSRDIARQQTRTLRGGRAYRMFFNPMWHLMGDALARPAGSYYYRTSETDCVFWHAFDQVLVRPDLIDVFDSGALSFLTEYPSEFGESVSLLSPGGIPRRGISDHLPLHFRLRLEDDSAV